jgi:hypothetical protein
LWVQGEQRHREGSQGLDTEVGLDQCRQTSDASYTRE